jgi:hypothetical protein
VEKTSSVSFLLVFMGIGLVVLNTIFPHTVTVQETALVPRTRETPLERANDYRVSGSSYSGYDLEIGKTIMVSWQADNTVIVYLMTESQFNIFKPLGIPTQSLKSQSGMSGSFTYSPPYSGRYYVVIYNPNWLLTQVRIVYYEAKLTWQEIETVTTTNEVNDNLYLYGGLPILIIGIVLLIVKFPKQKVENACGTASGGFSTSFLPGNA